MKKFYTKYGLLIEKSYFLKVSAKDFYKVMKLNVRKSISLPYAGIISDTFSSSELVFAGRVNKDDFRIRKVSGGRVWRSELSPGFR